MPPNTLRVHTEYVLVKSVGPKSCGLSHERRDWRILPTHAEIVEVEIGGVAIYRPFWEFRRAKSYCHLSCMVLKANDRRTSIPFLVPTLPR
ncbi:uncharacterized protein TNCV_834931 [Trichonephila clavipes]|nr:uncharacterized protein TNCV_834931 [Trichonephila clavipes]